MSDLTEFSEEVALPHSLSRLIETQDQFLAILGVDFRSPQNYFDVLDMARFPANLFLKHLMVLSDLSGKVLNRINDNFYYFFPEGQIQYQWRNKTHTYHFHRLPITGFSNEKLGISNKVLFENRPLNELFQDLITLLLFGSACTTPDTAEKLAQCSVGSYLGKSAILQELAKQRYIELSRIVNGIKSGHLSKKRYILATVRKSSTKFNRLHVLKDV